VPVDLHEGAMEELPAGAVVERSEVEHEMARSGRRGEPRVEVEELVTPDGHGDDRAAGRGGRKSLEHVDHGDVGVVHVVDDHDEGPVAGRGSREEPRRAGQLVRTPPASRTGDGGRRGEAAEAEELQRAVGQVAPVVLLARVGGVDGGGDLGALLGG
jgi:hypothetical protein